MTSRSETKLRSRVLYYWAASRHEPVVELGPAALRSLLELDDWPAPTVMRSVIDELRKGMGVDVLANGGLRIRVVSDDQVEDVFLHWQMRTGRTRTRLSGRRRAKIKARLSDGFSVTQLKQACDGLMGSSWHRGANPNRTPYLGIDVVFKSADSVERFMETGMGDQSTDFDGDEVAAIREEWKRRRGG
jgi:hypothetical protein